MYGPFVAFLGQLIIMNVGRYEMLYVGEKWSVYWQVQNNGSYSGKYSINPLKTKRICFI
jgi:hypothetical protein